MNRTQNLKYDHSPNTQTAFLHPAGSSEWGREISDFLTLGRDSNCAYILKDPSVSLRHARIEKKENGYLLRDLKSRNGTLLNGSKVLEAFLHEGDRIQLGSSLLVFSHSRNLFEKEAPITSKNPQWSKTLQNIENLAQSDLPVLLLGPSGSGKEVLARSLHQKSFRKNSPLICVNCSALSESLIESELFGHTKGSFTGATESRKGAFEFARGGTLFLDEVGDLPLALQPKLLRALENKEIRPVGSDINIKTDVRIIAATHQDLREKIFMGEFRLDLYYRLNVLQIKAPALIDRMEDFDDLLVSFCKEYQLSFSVEALNALKNYPWPGNIRELKNLVAKAKIYYGKEVKTQEEIKKILEETKEGFKPSVENEAPPAERKLRTNLNSSLLKELEYELIRKRLIANNGNQRQTALDLGIPKSTLHDRIKAYNKLQK